MPSYRVEFTIMQYIDLEDEVIDAVDDEWRGTFYNLRTEEEIVEHIAANLLRGAKLSKLDGWADQPDSNAKDLGADWRVEKVEKLPS